MSIFTRKVVISSSVPGSNHLVEVSLYLHDELRRLSLPGGKPRCQFLPSWQKLPVENRKPMIYMDQTNPSEQNPLATSSLADCDLFIALVGGHSHSMPLMVEILAHLLYGKSRVLVLSVRGNHFDPKDLTSALRFPGRLVCREYVGPEGALTNVRKMLQAMDEGETLPSLEIKLEPPVESVSASASAPV